MVNLTFSPLRKLDRLTNSQQLSRLKGAAHPGNSIREPQPGRRVDRLGLVETRDLIDRDGVLAEKSEGPPDLGSRLSQIRTKSYIAVILGHM
jgi:hypothetical protein